MSGKKLNRRSFLTSAAALPLAYAMPARAAAPPAQSITPALIYAAKKEGAVVWYTSADLQLAELVGKTFERAYPGISIRVERAGGERIFARVAQEYASGIHTPDSVSTGDAAQFSAWKRQGLLAPYVPEDVARYIPEGHRDPDGFFATARSSLCVIAYNTELVKRDAAPKSFADLLDPKWKGDLPDGARARLALSGEIVEAECDAGAIGHRHAKESHLGRAPGDGGRQRIQRADRQGERQADRDRLCGRRHALDRAAVGDFRSSAPSQCRAAVPEFPVHASGAAVVRR
jgi:hypothetical protein